MIRTAPRPLPRSIRLCRSRTPIAAIVQPEISLFAISTFTLESISMPVLAGLSLLTDSIGPRRRMPLMRTLSAGMRILPGSRSSPIRNNVWG